MGNSVDTDFKSFIEKQRVSYKNIGKVFCPILNEDVVFNAKGFYHLRYNGLGKERSVREQISRISLVGYSVSGVMSATRVSEYRERLKQGKNIKYWALESLISNNSKIVTVLRREGNGSLTFYSNWKEKIKKPSEVESIL